MNFVKIDENSKSLEYLGFMERKVYGFESNTNISYEESQILEEILNSEIYFETDKVIEYQKGEKSKKYYTRVNGPITDSILLSDFIKLSYHGLKETVREFEKESDWGEDLPIFNKLFSDTAKWIEENEYYQDSIYFVNADVLEKDKVIEFNFFTYFISLIIISITKSKVVIINHGGD